MKSSVENCTFLGYPAITARNDQLEITLVPALGSNLMAIKHVPSGLAVLRTPDSMETFHENPFLVGMPVLFPPNRLEDGKLPCGDTVYSFDLNEPKLHNHIHGLVHDKPWKVVRQEVTNSGAILETELDSADFPDIQLQFPLRFVLRMTSELDGSQVRIGMTVENHSNVAFPWGLGYHTTFRFPLANDGDLSRCTMTLTAKRRWALSDRLLPTGVLLESEDLKALREGIVLVDKPLDDVFLSSVVDGGGNECVLTDPDAGLLVRYTADHSFLHWVIYNNDSHQGYVCPEPYTWVTNAPNLSLDAKLTGLRTIQPGEKVHTSTEIVVESL